MRKNNVVRVRRRRLSLPQKLRKLKTTGDECIITFVMPDGSKLSETLSEKFLEKKKIGQIITDLYAISHDRGAINFVI